MKKRLLLIAVAGAIVVGCADEMLDTSYESVLKEAQLKGEHPMIFNAYVGNGMAVTRNLVSSGDFLTKASHMTGDYYDSSHAIDKSAGVFAYYTGSTYINTYITPGKGMYETSPSAYTEDSGHFYLGTSDVNRFNTFLDNTRLKYYSTSNWKTYFISASGASYNQERTVYWPAKQYASSVSEHMSFFAYYPHVNVGCSSYDKALKNGSINLRLVRDGYTIPALDYTVATPADNFSSLDLMAAVPQKNVKITSSPTAVALNFKHLLAAVSVKIKYSDDDSNTKSPEIFFTNAELRGADSNGEVKSNTQFRKRGIFSLLDGKWKLFDSFEPLNLLGYSWLTQELDFYDLSASKYYSFLDKSKSTTSSDWSVSSANDLTVGSKVSNDKYMFIIPNSNQEKLALDLSYLIKNGSYTENIDIQKTLDLKIKPGKVYQILLQISKNKLTFNVNVNVNDWTINTPGTNEGI